MASHEPTHKPTPTKAVKSKSVAFCSIKLLSKTCNKTERNTKSCKIFTRSVKIQPHENLRTFENWTNWNKGDKSEKKPLQSRSQAVSEELYQTLEGVFSSLWNTKKCFLKMNLLVIDFKVIRPDNNVTRNTFPKSKRTFCKEVITSFVLKGIYRPCFCHFATHRQLKRQTRTVQELIFFRTFYKSRKKLSMWMMYRTFNRWGSLTIFS